MTSHEVTEPQDGEKERSFRDVLRAKRESLRRRRRKGDDTKLREAMNAVESQFRIRSKSARLVHRYSTLERDEGLYEVEGLRGEVFEVIRSRTGAHTVFKKGGPKP